MVTAEKERGALLAIHAILVLTRTLAYQGSFDDLAHILDVAEYLPTLLLEPVDRTAEFREQLVGLAQRHPLFAHALQKFDEAG